MAKKEYLLIRKWFVEKIYLGAKTNSIRFIKIGQ